MNYQKKKNVKNYLKFTRNSRGTFYSIYFNDF